MSNENENRNITLIQHYKRDYSKVAHKLAKYHGRNYPWTRGPLPPPLILFKKNIMIIYICVYMCVLILAILFYKITFYFLLTISLILLRVMLYS